MKVALFVTCLTDTFYPRVGEACVRVLRHFGCDVAFPTEQTCCGQPAINSGFRTEGAVLARRLIEVFEPYEQVVSPSASCISTIRHHYVELLKDDPELAEKAERLAEKTEEIAIFLERRLGVRIAEHLELAEPATFHWPCHARGVYSPMELEQWAGGPETLRGPQRTDLCCGFGGSFALDFPQISLAMMNDKLSDLTATGARQVICNEGGCALHLSGGAHRRGLPLRFRHVIEVLAESLGLMEPSA